ncbi:GNAT family N-acyltransferase [Moorena sp. SIO3H5]|uniref:N-acyl amino acid synthase FeeM domain-containing protein n=1 Tax=Moorena sp. SIO3H5 TaxID=2607834 RepID=UPI0013B9F6A5|nr:GNAT family N-acyltransferase [Moorena sp. SIO3H5]NEO72804.1 GNAT family N-acetyltransferase [Moorena sp. SIO3H5]
MRIAIIENREGIQNILKLRYQVLVSEYGYLPKNHSKIITDKYDLHSSTIHIGAFNKNSEIIGSIRVVMNSKIGIPSEDYFDFITIPLPPEYGRPNLNKDVLADLSRLVITKNFCANKLIKSYKLTLSYQLITISNFFAKKSGATVCCAVVNPKLSKLFSLLGYRPIGSESICDKNKLPFIPFIGEINELVCRPIMDKI